MIMSKPNSAEFATKAKLHPLIHTLPTRNLTQAVEKKNTERGTQHFLSLNQDIVVWS